ncbi:MAG TPA: phosphopantothenate/pantothenate synthetase [Thermoplasmata archaeon]|nr:phosphopantothenate/pantothenate synthetase [Thermoplasmata archaeon]
MRLSRRHPRYRSLVVRAGLARAHAAGLVVGEGLIAHGRGEAFDYLLGERTSPSARRAEAVAAEWLRAARHPVVSVNGNVAALAAAEVAALSRAVPGLRVEVNLFHRTPGRAAAIARRLRATGVRTVLGVRPTARLGGLPSDRARVDRRGIFVADVCLVPLEDGDRAEALRRRGTKVIAIDLNPLSRTSRRADLPIVDELTRALREIARAAVRQRGRPAELRPFDAAGARAAALRTIARTLRGAAARRPRRGRPPPAARRSSRGSSGRSRRTR